MANRYIFSKNVCYIELIYKDEVFGFAIIDKKDYPLVKNLSWNFNPFTGYVYSSTEWRTPGKIVLHRLLAKTPVGYETDHVNNNKLDNRRKNLRTCTRSQNEMNKRVRLSSKSGFKGVSWCNQKNKWRVITGYKHVGFFANKYDAARAYNEAAKIHFGEFAKLNRTPVGRTCYA